MKPIFKEKDDLQYALRNGVWEKVSEETIDSLWQIWVTSPLADRCVDTEGFVVFGLKEVNND